MGSGDEFLAMTQKHRQQKKKKTRSGGLNQNFKNH